HAKQTGAHRSLQAACSTHARGQRLARALSTLLDREIRPTHRVPGGRLMAGKPSLTIKRRFNAPPEKVFSAWTDPEKVKRWMGPGEVQVLLAEGNARTGGHYRWLMKSPDGNEHDVSGVYREVVPNQKLVFTWTWKSTPERESLVTIMFKADG